MRESRETNFNNIPCGIIIVICNIILVSFNLFQIRCTHALHSHAAMAVVSVPVATKKKLSNFMRMFGNFFYTFLDVFCFTFCLDLLVSFVALFSLTNERGLSSARAPMLADNFFASNEYTEYSEHRTPSKYFLVMNISFPCCSSLLLRCWRACFSNVRNSFFVSSTLVAGSWLFLLELELDIPR